MTRDVTAKDIAHAAGVSQTAVSRAFSASASISAKKREAILAIANAMGYEPPSMKTVAALGSGTVAFIAADINNPFYPVAADVLARALLERGRHLILHTVPSGYTIDEVLQHVLRHRSEAVIVASATMSSETAAACRRAAMPLILFNRTQLDPLATAVVCDNYAGGRLVAQRFLDQGRRRIAFLGGIRDTSTHMERRRGFSDRLAQSGDTISAETMGGFSYEGARAAAKELLARPDPPDAIFAANDVMGLAVIDVARGLGFSIPDQLATVGFDDIPMASWASYDLTTVRQPVNRMVADVLDLIEAQRSDQAIAGTVRILPVHLVARGSG